MTRREVVLKVVAGERSAYVPWSFSFTQEALEKLEDFFGRKQVEVALQNHVLDVGQNPKLCCEMENNRWQDHFGVVWNRTVDKDVGWRICWR